MKILITPTTNSSKEVYIRYTRSIIKEYTKQYGPIKNTLDSLTVQLIDADGLLDHNDGEFSGHFQITKSKDKKITEGIITLCYSHDLDWFWKAYCHEMVHLCQYITGRHQRNQMKVQYEYRSGEIEAYGLQGYYKEKFAHEGKKK